MHADELQVSLTNPGGTGTGMVTNTPPAARRGRPRSVSTSAKPLAQAALDAEAAKMKELLQHGGGQEVVGDAEGVAHRTRKVSVTATALHPGYTQMVRAALLALCPPTDTKKGASRAAILKYIVQNFTLGEQLGTINAHLRQALRRGVESGNLRHTKGVGASGSFLLVAVKEHPKKPVRPAGRGPKLYLL
ncbi:unnamed protein product, partial [Anisakis simplex]|uniref:H15 domain-containing protein n=1 Tax=Anisakis simplex TaxID=6269 RepID=A0A0M3JJ51_ANISI